MCKSVVPLESEDARRKRLAEGEAKMKVKAKTAAEKIRRAKEKEEEEGANEISYPEGIKSPKVELNVNAKDGNFRYDRGFPLQFAHVCKSEPDYLPPLDEIGLEPADQSHPMGRGGSGYRRMGPPSSAARQTPIGLGIVSDGSSLGKVGPSGSLTMGRFSIPGKLSSEERFKCSTAMSGAPGVSSGRPAPMMRPKHIANDSVFEETPAVSENEGVKNAIMSVSGAARQIEQDLKEFFAIRNMDEAEFYFTKLPTQHRFRLVDKLVTSAIESKEGDAKLVAELFELAVEKGLCPPAAFEKGFTPTAYILDDIAIDAPKAFDLMAIMLKGARLDDDRLYRVASKTMDSDKLIALLS